MIYYYPERYKEHWDMLAKTVDSHYAHEYHLGDVLVFSPHTIGDHFDAFRERHRDNKLIAYQLEPMGSDKHWWTKDKVLPHILKYDEVWDYDYKNIVILRECGVNAKFKPILPTPSLQLKQNSETLDIDVLFIGAFSEYRMSVLSKLYYMQNTKYNFIVLANIQHPLLDDYIARSKIVINLHNSDDQTQQEQTRLTYLLNYGKIIFSEKSDINYYGDCISEHDNIDSLFSALYYELENYDANKQNAIRDKFLKLTYNDYLNVGLEWERNYGTQV